VGALQKPDVISSTKTKKHSSVKPLYIMHVSTHGLIRASEPQIGFDRDTGGQVIYVLDLVKALSRHRKVRRVDLLTRQIIDKKLARDYAVEKEPMGGNATLWRIPCGPNRYIHKEKLWPHLQEFIDNTLRFIRRQNDIPDVIHAHYADAGLVGARIAKVLGIPLIFTAHSLGRYKRQRLLAEGMSAERAEQLFHFNTRTEAEEETLETAAMVIASSRDEVERQYRLYDRYNRYAMKIIPPGCDLERFSKPPDADAQKQFHQAISPFLRDPRKPALTIVARPDVQKNVGAALRIFAEGELRTKANLLMFIGQRAAYDTLATDQQAFFTDLLWKVDEHNLYGRVAYPQTHNAAMITAAFHHARRTGGAILNLSRHENFGLTLVEAAAAGAPVVSSGAGGMADILETAKHGIRVDPEDPKSSAEAVLALLNDDQAWNAMSENGRRAAARHYSWKAHVKTYLDEIARIQNFRSPFVLRSHRPRRLASARYMLVSDIDGTLTGNRQAVTRLNRMIERRTDLLYGVATGRNLASALEVLKQWQITEPQFLITSVGTAIHFGSDRLREDPFWSQHIRFGWQRERALLLLKDWPGLVLQEDEGQSRFKLSFYIEKGSLRNINPIKTHFRKHGLRARAMISSGEGDRQCLDILPLRASKGHAMRYFAWRYGFDMQNIIAAGDAGNDLDMLRGCTKAIVVANHSPELRKLRRESGVYFSEKRHGWGVIDGLSHYGLEN
jgi:sucrose-phosphate synthase